MLYSDERHVHATSDDSNYRLSLPFLGSLASERAGAARAHELPLKEAAQGLLAYKLALRLGSHGLCAGRLTASLSSRPPWLPYTAGLSSRCGGRTGARASASRPIWLAQK